MSPPRAVPAAGPMARRPRVVGGAAVWLPLLAWMAAIYWFSNQPDLPHAPDAVLDLMGRGDVVPLVSATVAEVAPRSIGVSIRNIDDRERRGARSA